MLALGFYLVIKGESPFETAVRTVLCPMVPTGSACKRVVSAPAQGASPGDPAGEAAKVDEEKKPLEEKLASEIDAKRKAEDNRRRAEQAAAKADEIKRLNEKTAADAEAQRLADEKAKADAAAQKQSDAAAKAKADAASKQNNSATVLVQPKSPNTLNDSKCRGIFNKSTFAYWNYHNDHPNSEVHKQKWESLSKTAFQCQQAGYKNLDFNK